MMNSDQNENSKWLGVQRTFLLLAATVGLILAVALFAAVRAAHAICSPHPFDSSLRRDVVSPEWLGI